MVCFNCGLIPALFCACPKPYIDTFMHSMIGNAKVVDHFIAIGGIIDDRCLKLSFIIK
jgi:hypothetical protein